MYVNGDGVKQDYRGAVYWFRKAALQGDPLAQLSLGYRYEHGQGVERDYKQAWEWYKKSADQNHAQAAYEVARLCAEGKGVQKDLKLSVAWLTKAAEAGYALAERKLGFAYLTGSGVKRDWIEAYKWLVIFEEQTGAPLDLDNPNWAPGAGSFALKVREQFKTLMSPQQIRVAEEATRRWLDTHH
jgi:TPR repeat protein